ncbi:MAG: hypothetical protein IIZ78_21585, partial [Clostridiales bacterium]|nr:hypothetical protein [Clostridiales bacterium]
GTMREIEQDGYITRDADLSGIPHTCFNCGAYKYFIDSKRYKCIEGHIVDAADWRQKYSVCDQWRQKK